MEKTKRKGRSLARSGKKLMIAPYAWGVLAAYFGWGTDGAWNANEQICALGGRITNAAIWVEAALPLLSAGASSVTVHVKGETWMNAVFMLQDIGSGLIGSAHTHPGGLGVFLSGDDVRTQKSVFPAGVSVVVNPQRMELAAFDERQARMRVRLPLEAAGGARR